MRWQRLRVAFVATLGLLAGGALGCAEEREPINRVQPNALAKSFFVGADLRDNADNPEFYTQPTLVDVGYGQDQSTFFSSLVGTELSRIKWEITEDLLIGRLAYERIEGTDGKQGVGKSTDKGVIVVAYPISSHFDIRYDYNPTTGEEMNVLVENSSDKAWYDRQYFRVDWSKNLNTNAYDFNMLSMLGLYEGVTYEPMAYYVNDPDDPDAPHFDDATGYFDVTNKAFATPGVIDLSHLGWGIDSFPACFLDADFAGGTAPSGSCNPSEITIRQSFRKVVDEDFEPQDWDGHRFGAFGAFNQQRYGYARNYGMSDDKWHRFANRHQIWERSHYYGSDWKGGKFNKAETMEAPIECFTPTKTPAGSDPHRDADNNGTEDECEEVTALTGLAGSRCDEFKQICTLPYRARPEKPIVWYYATGSDMRYFDSAVWATNDWDTAMRGAVLAARNAECKATGGDPAACDQQYLIYHGQMDDHWDAVQLTREVQSCRTGRAYKGQDCNALADKLGAERQNDPGVIAVAKMNPMVVMCHSPVLESDDPACGPVGRDVRMGDIRYHQVHMIPYVATGTPWGYGPGSYDPLTGQQMSASINVFTYATDAFTQTIVDQLRYLSGELSTADVTEGTYVKDWAVASEAAGGTGALPPMSALEVSRRLSSSLGVMPKDLANVGGPGSITADPQFAETLLNAKDMARDIKADAYAPSSNKAIYEARRQHAVGSTMEAELTTPPMMQLAGLDGVPAAASIAAASPLRGNNLEIQIELRRLRDNELAKHGTCLMEASFPSPIGLTSIEKIITAKFKDTINPRTGKPYGAFGDPAANTKQDQLDRAAAVHAYLAQKASYAVLTHEIGHTMGQYHNFVSSADAWGYRPQYWQLRTKNGTVSTKCADLKTEAEAEACIGPRYFDPVTPNEREQLLPMFMAESTMDYAGELTQDFIGLGAYDFGAARMFYGETVAVHADADMNSDKNLGKAALAKMDGFGGLLGMTYTSNGQTDIHYSELQKTWKLITPGSCRDLTDAEVQGYKPADWNDTRDGAWDPLLDGLIVKVNGKYSKCKQRKVDYVPWQAMKDNGTGFQKRFSSVDAKKRTRVPYGFAQDGWADIGNAAVYRHDNGADPYELYNFWITQQEVGHIFDNYRRNRQSFSVRSASNRTLGRFNEKMRDAAKGLGLLINIYRDFALEAGFDFDTEWPSIAKSQFPDNILASGLAFDHFARQLARPQASPHQIIAGDKVLRSTDDIYSQAGVTAVIVPNGATGYRSDVSTGGPAAIGIGGRLLESRLADDRGNDYDRYYTLNCGSYYDKAFAAMLMTESADNFISSSRSDFLDGRFRAISLADVFPDGYRRWLGTNLTGDDYLKGAWVKAANNKPVIDAQKFPTTPIGWTSWWPAEGPQVCFPGSGTSACSAVGWEDTPFEGEIVDMDTVMPLEPQVGWEQQKFLIAWTMNYLPENSQQWWLNMLNMWEYGADGDPGLNERIEFHDPTGKVYVAKTFGTEVFFPGSKYEKTVQKGISARVLQYANDLLFAAYDTTAVDYNADGKTDWYLAKINPATGLPLVKWDPTIQGSNPLCTSAVNNTGCTCTSNRSCVALSRYVEIPFFIRQSLAAYGLADPSMKGVY